MTGVKMIKLTNKKTLAERFKSRHELKADKENAFGLILFLIFVGAMILNNQI
jgi:hypothetical protein